MPDFRLASGGRVVRSWLWPSRREPSEGTPRAICTPRRDHDRGGLYHFRALHQAG